MSILTAPLPDCIVMDGNKYRLNTGFKTWLRFESIMKSRDLSPTEKTSLIFELCFKEPPPPCGALFEALWDFYLVGRERTASEKKTGKPLISFEDDGEYIYAAFYSQYGIDLTKSNMHWHKFRALFAGLGEDNMIVKIMHYRGVDLSRIKDKGQKAFYRKMKRAYAIRGYEADAAMGLEALYTQGGAKDE